MAKDVFKENMRILLKAGLPYTILGMVIVLGGLYALRRVFDGSEYLSAILFLWLALFWFIYQPLFRNRIRKVSGNPRRTK